MDTPVGFDVFLSHNSKDKDVVRLLAEKLKGEGLKVWLDEEQLIPGRTWQEAIEEVLKTVKSASILIGRDGLGPWVVPEMRICLMEFASRNLPVIPILLPGAPEKPEIPGFLRLFTWVDLREGMSEKGIARIKVGVLGQAPATSITLKTSVTPTPFNSTSASNSVLAKRLMSLLFQWALRNAIRRLEEQERRDSARRA